MAKRVQLTHEEWREVFRIRCRSKEGRPNSDADRALANAAFNEDADRYSSMSAAVFNATVPFGSDVRLPEPPTRKRRAGPDRREHRRGHGERRGRR